VDLLPQITGLDYPHNEAAQQYRALCETPEWKFVCASRQLHVFYTWAYLLSADTAHIPG
jgi:hypothetical protein